MHSYTLLFFVSLLISPLAMSQEDQIPDSKREKLQHVVELLQLDQLAQRMTLALFSQYRSGFPKVPKKFWDDAYAEIAFADFDQQVLNIYADTFTEAELEEILIFYQSEIGQKMLQEQAALSARMQQLGSSWGVSVGEQIKLKLEEAGFLKDQQ